MDRHLHTFNSYEEVKDGKVVDCRDIGFDCDGVIRAETEEEVLKLVAEQANDAHNLATVAEEVVAKVRKVMRDE